MNKITMKLLRNSSLKVIFRTMKGYKKERKNVLLRKVLQPQRRTRRTKVVDYNV